MTEECCAGRSIVKGVVGAVVSITSVVMAGKAAGIIGLALIFCHVVVEIATEGVAKGVRYKLYEYALAIFVILIVLLGVDVERIYPDTKDAMDSDPSV
jgi:hypothetical protein